MLDVVQEGLNLWCAHRQNNGYAVIHCVFVAVDGGNLLAQFQPEGVVVRMEAAAITLYVSSGD